MHQLFWRYYVPVAGTADPDSGTNTDTRTDTDSDTDGDDDWDVFDTTPDSDPPSSDTDTTPDSDPPPSDTDTTPADTDTTSTDSDPAPQWEGSDYDSDEPNSESVPFTVGCQVKVYWPGTKHYYKGTVIEVCQADATYRVMYPGKGGLPDESHWHDLSWKVQLID